MAVVAPDVERIARLTRSALQDATHMGERDLRYLVDMYYQVQDFRIQSAAQLRALGDESTPGKESLLAWVLSSLQQVERTIQRGLDVYTDQYDLGRWAKSIVGVGPVLAAGLMAHIDVEQAPTVGHIWAFAGLDPTKRWEPGQVRPWNARLKVLAWKLGESFVKVQHRPKDVYGKVYAERKAYEAEKNERGEYADQAKEKLERFRIGKDTEAYKWYSKGKLPPGHIHARAKRYAVKLFLAHYHHVAYELRYGKPPPKPYILTQPGHTHFMAPPNWS